jgi:hypothetical protein
MVIPWVDFPLNSLVKLGEPTRDPKYLLFPKWSPVLAIRLTGRTSSVLPHEDQP